MNPAAGLPVNLAATQIMEGGLARRDTIYVEKSKIQNPKTE